MTPSYLRWGVLSRAVVQRVFSLSYMLLAPTTVYGGSLCLSVPSSITLSLLPQLLWNRWVDASHIASLAMNVEVHVTFGFHFVYKILQNALI